MWKNKNKFNGHQFFAGYEFDKNSKKRVLKFKNAKTGKEVKGTFGNAQQAHRAGWVKVSK